MSAAAGKILTIDRSLDQVSAVPAVAGEATKLFLRERVLDSVIAGADGHVPEDAAVLMVHGGFSPVEVAFDFQHPAPEGNAPYSWMAVLASAGFDVFAVNLTGYGASSRPMMDDPGNLAPEQQALLVPATIPEVRVPSYPYRLATSESEAADIDRAVEFIRELRGVGRVSLVGWSGGGVRVGTYALRHPDKVGRLVIWASSNYADDGPGEPPANLPEPGVPMRFQDRATGEGVRWLANVGRPGQVAPGVTDAIWRQSRLTDPLGASWGPGGLRAPTRTIWGWNARAAAELTRPTLVMVGEYDRLMASNRDLYAALGTEEKAFLAIDGGSHFMAWEKQRRVLHDASLAWLRGDGILDRAAGAFHADYEADITAAADAA